MKVVEFLYSADWTVFRNLKKKKKMSKHQLVGQSPSGSVANLVRRGSRPSSGAHQRSNSLLVPPDAAAAGLESKTSIGDAGELGYVAMLVQEWLTLFFVLIPITSVLCFTNRELSFSRGM